MLVEDLLQDLKSHLALRILLPRILTWSPDGQHNISSTLLSKYDGYLLPDADKKDWIPERADKLNSRSLVFVVGGASCWIRRLKGITCQPSSCAGFE